jgi:hypothetical protein
MFGQAVSKYKIVSVCVFVLTALDPPMKGYFVRISMVFFVLKGGEYALKYLRYKTIQSKCRLSWKK